MGREKQDSSRLGTLKSLAARQRHLVSLEASSVRFDHDTAPPAGQGYTRNMGRVFETPVLENN